jgi:hypothetical protein
MQGSVTRTYTTPSLCSALVEGDLGHRGRQREDDMEVSHWQQFGLSIRKPSGARQSLALRTMPVATRVVGDAGRTTIIALLDMATERRRPAGGDGAHDAPLDATEMTGVRLSERFAMAAENIRHLQPRSHGTRLAGWHDFQAEPIERARRVADRFGGDPGVARRASEAGVAEQDLDDGTSAPLSKRWVANVCRKVCTVTCLLKPAAAQAERQAACKTFGTSGRSSSRPGNSHRFGRASRQYVRRILSSCGESMT